MTDSVPCWTSALTSEQNESNFTYYIYIYIYINIYTYIYTSLAKKKCKVDKCAVYLCDRPFLTHFFKSQMARDHIGNIMQANQCVTTVTQAV